MWWGREGGGECGGGGRGKGESVVRVGGVRNSEQGRRVSGEG